MFLCLKLPFTHDHAAIIVTFQLSEEGPCEDLDGDSQLSSFSEWILPAKEFDGMWERLDRNTYII